MPRDEKRLASVPISPIISAFKVGKLVLDGARHVCLKDGLKFKSMYDFVGKGVFILY
jgi:hypothetical protein